MHMFFNIILNCLEIIRYIIKPSGKTFCRTKSSLSDNRTLRSSISLDSFLSFFLETSSFKSFIISCKSNASVIDLSLPPCLSRTNSFSKLLAVELPDELRIYLIFYLSNHLRLMMTKIRFFL